MSAGTKAIDARVVNIDELKLEHFSAVGGKFEGEAVRAGDFICCPVGGPQTAHQIVNDSDSPLCYISVSTMMPSEVCEYPDSGKVAAFGGSGAGRLRHITEASSLVDYWKGE